MSRRPALLTAVLLVVTGAAAWMITAKSRHPVVRTQAQVSGGVRVPFADIYAEPRPAGCEAYKFRLVGTAPQSTPTGVDYTVTVRNSGKTPCTFDGSPNLSVDRLLNGLDSPTIDPPAGAIAPAVIEPGQLGYVTVSTSRACGNPDRHDLDSLLFPDSYELLVHIPLLSGCPIGVSPWYRLGPPPPPLPEPGPEWEQVTVDLDAPTEAKASDHWLDYTLVLRNEGDRDLDLTAYCPAFDVRLNFHTHTIGTAEDRRLNCAAVPGKVLRGHDTLRFELRDELDSPGSLEVAVSLVDLGKSARVRVRVSA